ncbi:MAG: D-alanine--D-alanine ligase [Gammaproteobacteria bacterium]|nr:D-alanine--D-alanine ligase [Gammaproteobacteria bacterium]
MNTSTIKKVAVLYGGDSAEREISLRSGQAVYQALIANSIDAILFDPSEERIEQLKLKNVSHVWIALHGRGGEDGTVQAVLEYIGLPYTGSNQQGSAIAMDKWRSKLIWKALNYPVAAHYLVKKETNIDDALLRKVTAKLGPVMFVKPSHEGSSVGMSKVKSIDELGIAIESALKFDDEVLVESFVSGKEYTVSILNGKALPSISMVTPREFYDFTAKYNSTDTEYHCPSDLTSEEETEIGQLALDAFAALGCSGWGRVDFIRDSNSNDFKILEANTVPGMTESSLVPKAAKQVGIDFNQLVLEILKTSL